jgi:hypothetical protein
VEKKETRWIKAENLGGQGGSGGEHKGRHLRGGEVKRLDSQCRNVAAQVSLKG